MDSPEQVKFEAVKRQLAVIGIKDAEDLSNSCLDKGVLTSDYDGVQGLNNVILVEEKGGEGQGEEWYQVYYFSDYGVYVRIDGFYQSYDGVSFNGDDLQIKQVFPHERTTTEYTTKPA